MEVGKNRKELLWIQKKGLLQVHLAVLLFGMSSLFAKMVNLKPEVTGMDIGGLLLYGIVCTAIAHSMFIEGLKHVRVQTAGIISGLESVYGIIAAVILLHEIPSGKELIGGAIILGVVFYNTIKSE